jgi:glycosyltransferase involved in cell wall biosynthesis
MTTAAEFGSKNDLTSRPQGRARLHRERTLSVCMFAHSARLGGADRSLLELVNELVTDHGAVCTVVMPESGPLVDAMHRAGARCITADYAWWCAVRLLAEEAGQRRVTASINRVLGELCETVAKVDPDIVWTQTLVIPWGALVASLLRKPHVWSVCEYGERDHGLKFFWPFDRILADIAASSSLIYACTRDVAKELFPDIPPDRLRILYRHVTVPPLGAGAGADSPVRTRPNGVRLGIFGFLGPTKRQEDAIRAVAELVAHGRDVELLVAGANTGNYRQFLEGLASSLRIGDRVHFCGYLADPYPAMRGCDVIASCSRSEAFGRVAAEAMLLERPVVYPNTGGFIEYMVDGVTGLSYPAGDVAALAARLEELVDDPSRRHALGQAGRAHAERFFTAEKYGGEVFRSLMNMRARGAASCSIPSVLVPGVVRALANAYRAAVEAGAAEATARIRDHAATLLADLETQREAASSLGDIAVLRRTLGETRAGAPG